MAPAQPNHPQSGDGKQRRVLVIVVSFVILLLSLIFFGIVVYFRFFRNNDDTTETTDVESSITYDLVGSPFPAWPNSVPPPAEQVDTLAPPNGAVGVSLVAGSTDITRVFQWYRDTLPSFGYTLTAQVDDNSKLAMITPAGENAEVDFTELPTGEVGIVAYLVPSLQPPEPPTPTALPPAPTLPVELPATEEAPAGPPPSADVTEETAVAEAIEPTPTAQWPDEETAETESLSSDADAVTIPSAVYLGLSVSVSPESIYAGTLNQLTYTIVVTGEDWLTVTATLPDGVLFHPDDLSSAGFVLPPPNSGQPQQAIWKTHIGGGTESVSTEISGINDLLHPPDSLVMKVVVESRVPGRWPVVKAAILETEKY